MAGLQLELERLGTKFENVFVDGLMKTNFPSNVCFLGFLYFDERDIITGWEYGTYSFSSSSLTEDLSAWIPFKPLYNNFVAFQIFNQERNEINEYYQNVLKSDETAINFYGGILLYTKPMDENEKSQLTILLIDDNRKTVRFDEPLSSIKVPSKKQLEEQSKDTFNQLNRILEEKRAKGKIKIERKLINFVPPNKLTCFGLFLQGITWMNQIGSFLAVLNQEEKLNNHLLNAMLSYLYIIMYPNEYGRLNSETFVLLETAFGLNRPEGENCANYFTQALKKLLRIFPNNLVSQIDEEYYLDLTIFGTGEFPADLVRYLKNNNEMIFDASYQLFKINEVKSVKELNEIDLNGTQYQFIAGLGENYLILRMEDNNEYELIEKNEKGVVIRKKIKLERVFGRINEKVKNLKLLIYEKVEPNRS